MSDESVQIIEYNGRPTRVLRNGALLDVERGRIVQGTSDLVAQNAKTLIRSDNSRSLSAKRRAIGLRAQLRGIIEGTKGEVPDSVGDEITDDELLKAGSAVQALTAHMTSKFMQSNSLRGMGEVYDKLTAPLTGDKRQRDDSDGDAGQTPTVILMIAQYLSQHGNDE